MELAIRDMQPHTMVTRKIRVKFLLSDGERFKEKVRSFPLAGELASSGLLVVGTTNDDTVVAACGVRSVLNVLVLYVERNLRGHGVGAQVLRATIESAEKRKLHFVTLCFSRNLS